MTSLRKRSTDAGIAFVTLMVMMVPLISLAVFAVDLGRSYLIKAHIAKALDGAVLAAAQALGEGDTMARERAVAIFNANLPAGYLGVTSASLDLQFATAADGSRIVTASSNTTIPTNFARVIGRNQLAVAGRSQITRRLVDVSFVIDKSGSLRSVWPEVQDATQQFVKYFDPSSDRMSLVMFGGNTTVMDAMGSARGFDRQSILDHIADMDSGGSTATAEGLYQGWDQLRQVPSVTQSLSRIIVLFTDGSPNTFSGRFRVDDDGAWLDLDGALVSSDFPRIGNGGTDRPVVEGLRRIYGTPNDLDEAWVSPTGGGKYATSGRSLTEINPGIPEIPLQSSHPSHLSAGIPVGFDLYNPMLPGQRTLIGRTANGYDDHVQNANNAARNLAETIANAVRNDTSGAAPIRIYTLGLGDLLNASMGAGHETGSSILQRIANDRLSSDFVSGQPEGKYYFAGDTVELGAAFEAVRNLAIRFSE
jgi:Flp pilus assembly protein TadG